MKQLFLILFSMLFAVQSMAVSMSKLAQRRKWATSQIIKGESETLENMMKRMKFNPSEPDLNYFQKFRVELNRLAAEEHALSKTRGVLVNSAIKLPVDTFGFFIATGAVNFMTMWNTAGGNPLLFQEQVLNLKDPIATFSFYSFMAANGFYTRFRTDSLSDKLTAEAKAVALRRISYQSMAAGSLASSVVADVGNSIKQCAGGWLNSDPGVMEKTSKKFEANEKKCQEAMKVWTAKNLVEKYTPQIFSLLLVQSATEVIQSGTNKAITYSAKSLYKGLMAAGEKAGLQMLFVKVALRATPSSFAISTIGFVGKITQFTFFVGVDHLLNNTLTRAFNNLFKPFLFKTFEAYSLNSFFEVAGKYNWDISKISKLSAQYDAPSRAEKKSKEMIFAKFETGFPEAIKNFTTQVQGWRDHLNSDTEVELQSWLGMTNRILNQVQVSEQYYNTYIKNLFATSYITGRVNQPEFSYGKLTPAAYNNIPIYPYRKLPLFGVQFVAWEGSNAKEEDSYLSYPNETEYMQSKFLVTVVRALQEKPEFVSIYKSIPGPQIGLAKDTLVALESGNAVIQGKALKVFVAEYQKSLVNNNVEFRKFGKYILDLIGKPTPRLNEGEGFNAAFEIQKKGPFEVADFDLVDTNLGVNLDNPAQYLTRAMLCGGTVGKVKEYMTENGKINWFEPDFIPPRIVIVAPAECQIPSALSTSKDFYSSALTNPVTKKVYKNATDYIVQNIDRRNLLGDYTKKDGSADFNAWWKSHVMIQLPEILERWDLKYSTIVNSTLRNIFDRKSTFKKVIDSTQLNLDGENILGSSLVESYRFEKELYLQTINLVRNKLHFEMPASGDINILTESKKLSVGHKSLLKPLNSGDYAAVTSTLEEMIAELDRPITYLKPWDQIKSDEEIQAEEIKRNQAGDLLPTQMNYKNYLEIQGRFEKALAELEKSVGLKNEGENDLFESLISDDGSKSADAGITNKAVKDDKNPHMYEEFRNFKEASNKKGSSKDKNKEVSQDKTKEVSKEKEPVAEPVKKAEKTPQELAADEAKERQNKLDQAIVKASIEGLRNIEENISKYVRMKILMRRGLKFTEQELQKFSKEVEEKAAARSALGRK